MKAVMVRAIEVAGRVRAVAAASRWASIGGRAAVYAAIFVLLSLVGSGRLSRWLSPPARLVAVPVAEAAPLPPAVTALPSAAPAIEADGGAPAEASDAGASDTGAGVAADGKVILNLATEADLRRLPGVGPTRAKAILALRARLKKFTRVEDLLKVKGMGRRSIARIRPLVRVD